MVTEHSCMAEILAEGGAVEKNGDVRGVTRATLAIFCDYLEAITKYINGYLGIADWKIVLVYGQGRITA